mgnify:CR=1 FL=1
MIGNDHRGVPFHFGGWDGYGEEVSLDVILKYFTAEKSYSTTLSVSEQIVKHNIAHGDIFHRCTKVEWEDLLSFIRQSFGIDVLTMYRTGKGPGQRIKRMLMKLVRALHE